MHDLLTTADVASLARLDLSVVHRAIKSGSLVATRYGRDWLIDRAEAERYANSERKPGPKPRSSTGVAQ